MDAVCAYVEDLLQIIDVRQAHTTLRADHDFVVTQVRGKAREWM